MLALATSGLITAWVVIALRAALITTRIERQLSMAISAMCLLIAFYNPFVVDWLNRLIGLGSADVVRHSASIVTAIVMVSFAIKPSRPGHIRYWVAVGIATLAAVMLIRLPARFRVPLDWATNEYSTFGNWSIAYFVLLGGYCVSSLVATFIAFAEAAHVIENGYTRVSLWLINISLVLNAAPWMLTVMSLVTGEQIWVRYVPGIDGLNALFLSGGLLVALVGTVAASLRTAVTARRLHPFWLELTTSVPEVVLGRNQGQFWRPYDLQRLTVELRDCFLVLGAYLDQDEIDSARETAAELPILNGSNAAVSTAISLRKARANKAFGAPPNTHRLPIWTPTAAATLDEEVAELIRIGEAYQRIADNTT
ncbi:MAB_1171c family putative transporter [Mycobacteroides abscessus]|uniref:MAB_1171c family putative transporter n=1 Tax=Mycobacteroides abscessus TaxID=36809 RepID=UPI0012FFD97B|nr:MAB_1171c family putative transporter [Mycobacteroides abscessus]